MCRVRTGSALHTCARTFLGSSSAGALLGVCTSLALVRASCPARELSLFHKFYSLTNLFNFKKPLLFSLLAEEISLRRNLTSLVLFYLVLASKIDKKTAESTLIV